MVVMKGRGRGVGAWTRCRINLVVNSSAAGEEREGEDRRGFGLPTLPLARLAQGLQKAAALLAGWDWGLVGGWW